MLATENIEWHIAPTRSPHLNGLWEAVVKSLKHHLRRVACLNSRQLTPILRNPNEKAPLTPCHFLTGDPLTARIEPHIQEAILMAAHTEDRATFLVSLFQGVPESFQSRNKWTTEIRNPDVGEFLTNKEDYFSPV
ncbi:hypothetical protein PR048_020062 [Dryococelus australis]|uniref:Integrase catalytic domain-containing protein n=1 Tax=Dryococelus australis TaxID=614101 RepID=A0ABQ9H582_9NEOP|nr:hypothetical protein PR048_020062 [Dryococelus australis]